MDTKVQLEEAMVNLEEDDLMLYTQKLLDEKVSYRQIEKTLQSGMKKVGVLFEEGEYFLADLIFAGVLFCKAIELFQIQELELNDQEAIGRVVIGVMEGDIHDIGKDIIKQMLKTEGFQVEDLGVDVNKETFIQKVRDYAPNIVILSGVMGYSVEEMKAVIQGLEQEGTRNKVSVLVGGSCVNEKMSRELGADGYSEDPLDSVLLCKKIVEQKKEND